MKKIIAAFALCTLFSVAACSAEDLENQLNRDNVAIVKEQARTLGLEKRKRIHQVDEELSKRNVNNAAEICLLPDKEFLNRLRLMITYVDLSVDLEYLEMLKPEELRKRNDFVELFKSLEIQRHLDHILSKG